MRKVSWLLSYVARNFLYMKNSVAYDDRMKITFMTELYTDTNIVNRSR